MEAYITFEFTLKLCLLSFSNIETAPPYRKHDTKGVLKKKSKSGIFVTLQDGTAMLQ